MQPPIYLGGCKNFHETNIDFTKQKIKVFKLNICCEKSSHSLDPPKHIPMLYQF